MESFIRVLPASWNAEFIGKESEATYVSTVETVLNEEQEEVTKYVFFFKDNGKETQLNNIIATYVENYTDHVKPEYIQQVIDRMYQEFQSGFTVPEGKGGALATKILQVRDVEDRTNWLTSQVSYSAAVSAGLGAELGAKFRTADNTTVEVTYTQGYEALLEMAKWGSSIMNRCWVLKDAVTSATTPEELNTAIATLDEGWPSSPVA